MGERRGEHNIQGEVSEQLSTHTGGGKCSKIKTIYLFSPRSAHDISVGAAAYI